MRPAGLSAVVLMLAVVLGVGARSAAGRPASAGVSKAAAAYVTGAATASARPAASPPEPAVTIAAVGDTMIGNTPDLPPDPQG